MAKPKYVTIKTDVSKVLKHLKKASAKEKEALGQAMTQIAFLAEGEVKRSISGERAEPQRVDTGRYRGSIKGVPIDNFNARVESNVEYGPYIEYGTSRMKEGRHMRNSITRNQTEFIKIIKSFISKVK